jgi:AcrR family transcriptional regulator
MGRTKQGGLSRVRPGESVAVLVEEDGRKSELINKSARLFREKGYEKTTVRDIAAAAGMQAGSWFYHFKSKHDILLAIVEQGLQQSLAQIREIVAQELPAREMFKALVRAHLNTLLAPNNDFIPVLLYEGRSLEPEARAKVAALTNQYEMVWDQVLLRLQQSGDWALPGKLDRLMLFGSLNWTAQWYRQGVGLSIEQLAEHAIHFLLRTPEPR